MKIPAQLENEQFIVLREHGKEPLQRWKDKQYHFSSGKIEQWLAAGYNYGVVYTSDLAVLDADNVERLWELGIIEALQPTFTVRTGRVEPAGAHLYLRIVGEGPTGKIILNDPKTGENLGDIRLPHTAAYNVGPGCIHPSGKRYTILIDEPIRSISWPELEEILHPLSYQSPKQKAVKRPPHATSDGLGLDAYGFNCLDFLSPLNAVKANGEIIGAHPIHGSTTGSNLAVTADGSKWYCRRCGSGGGWLQALAVSEGIIECSEAGRSFSADEWKQINAVLKERKPGVYKKQHREFVARRRKEKQEIKNILLEIGNVPKPKERI